MVGYWNTVDWPEDIRVINKSWRTYGPENIIVYHSESAMNFIEEFYGVRELDAFKACAIPAMQSDLFRVLEIYKNGGFYMDLGIELLSQPIQFVAPKADLVLYRRWHGRIANGIFAATAKKSSFWRLLTRFFGISRKKNPRIFGRLLGQRYGWMSP